MATLNISRKSVIPFALEVRMANPNGNIDDGSPRITGSEYGYISPMCIRRQIRNLVEDHNSPVAKAIFAMTGLAEANFHVFESMMRGMKANSPAEALDQSMNLFKTDENAALQKYVDIRLFGATILEETKKDQEKNQEKNQEKLRLIRTGVVNVCMPLSLKPIEIVMEGVTRKASTQNKDHDREGPSTGMIGQSALKVVRHGIYYGALIVCPGESHKTHASDADIEFVKKIIPYLFSTKATSRTDIHVRQATCIDHPNVLGVVPDFVVLNACRPSVLVDHGSPSESDAEYSFPTLDEIKKRISEKSKHASELDITDLLNP